MIDKSIVRDHLNQRRVGMNNPSSHSRLVSLTVALLFALVAQEMRSQPPAQNAAGISFENRQPRSGVDFALNNGTTFDKPIIDGIPGGVALLDYDNDGFLGIVFTNDARIPSLSKEGPNFYNRLYHNNHDGTFADVTEKAGVSGVNSAGKKLLSVSAAWIDYDNDGRLDLFVTNYLDWSPETSKVCGPVGTRLSCPPSLYTGQPNLLYHNNGDGTFTDVSAEMGIAGQVGKGMGVAIADYDGDGWMDIFVANDNERNFLFRNVAGKRFEELGVESSVAY